MNLPDIESILVGAAVSTLSLGLFIYFGERLLKFFKISKPNRILQNRRSFDGEALNRGNKRRRIKSNLILVCSLPIHQEKRPEAPLS